MLAFAGLTKRYGAVVALDNLDLDVPPGQLFGLLGPNGAGKTTLIKIVLGIVRKTGGRATLLGRPAGDRRGRRQVGYLPEGHRIPRHLTGNTALEYYGGLSGLTASQIKERRPKLLETVGLADWGTMSVKKYSKGMLQRLGLAQAMLHDPELLILDEPTDGVDPVGRAELREILVRLRGEGKSIFLNSHMLQEVELVCDRTAILDKGALRHVGNVQEITEASGTEVIFNVKAREELLRSIIDDSLAVSWKAVGADRFQIGMRVADQSEIDGAIDRLRKAGVSIYSMTPRRMTLEEAFLQLIRSPSGQAPSGMAAKPRATSQPMDITEFGTS